MKIEVAQITTDPGRIEQNTTKIIDWIEKAKADQADIVVFPELAVPGYMSLDLMLYKEYLEQNKKALDTIAQHTEGIMAIVGFIDYEENSIGPDDTPIRYNSAAVLYDRMLVDVVDKTLLPDYDVFYENRYFHSARKRELIPYKQMNIGVEICEDLWDEHYDTKVSGELVRAGADLLINISASPFYINKRLVRERLIKNIVERYKVPFVYTNMVGGQDGYDGELVFDGQSMAFDGSGMLVGLGKMFEEDVFLVDLNNAPEVTYSDPEPTEQLYKGLVLGIKEYFRRTGFNKAFIGLSGGIDSAVTAVLAVKALGRKSVVGIGMPSWFSSRGSVDDARVLADNLGINFKIIPIQQAFEAIENTLEREFYGLPKDVTEENIQARLRGLILMAEANKFRGLVISTGNKTETALGYSTLYGDMCGGLAAISDVSKMKIYDLARFINDKYDEEIIPQNTINKAPSAELRENQTDEKSLGDSYSIISPLVDEIVEEGKTSNELYKKYPQDTVRHVIDLIRRNEYKRRQAPPGIKVTKKAFGVGRRIPIAHSF